MVSIRSSFSNPGAHITHNATKPLLSALLKLHFFSYFPGIKAGLHWNLSPCQFSLFSTKLLVLLLCNIKSYHFPRARSCVVNVCVFSMTVKQWYVWQHWSWSLKKEHIWLCSEGPCSVFVLQWKRKTENVDKQRHKEVCVWTSPGHPGFWIERKELRPGGGASSTGLRVAEDVRPGWAGDLQAMKPAGSFPTDHRLAACGSAALGLDTWRRREDGTSVPVTTSVTYHCCTSLIHLDSLKLLL